MTTIRDVSKYSGVSVATVSRVLNNSNKVKSTTKKKVLQAIKELNYKPNAVAKTLFKKQSYSIGLIIPDISNPFFPEVARAVEDTARHYGYRVILCNSDGNSEKEKDYVETLSQNHVDGLLVTSISENSDNFKGLHMPVVALDRSKGKEIPCVYVDNYEGGKLAAQTLFENGGKVFGEISGPSNLITAKERSRGFHDFLKKQKTTAITYESEFDFKHSIVVAGRLLDENPEVDSVFVGNDQIGIALLKEAMLRGIRIPDDLQIIGFDGIEIGGLITPSLSTIQQPIYELGKEATKLLLALANKKSVEQTSICMPINYVKRSTTIG
ncbi:LacI family DNA-binding transcriptional regulator [Oceanobacillus sp. FSL K6-3682]|uniref:LacI family DNA-binding transcriptional regulator n=1 Tax=Oceanobacillus sp. FSL K6-3682 TaxID=2921503 RepID=UPI0030D89CFD